MTQEKSIKDSKKVPSSFRRSDAHKKSKLGLNKWRKPRGIQNKMRLRKRGYAPVVKKGYQTSKETRGSTRNGLKPILISNLSQLEKINSKSESIIILSNLGTKKRLEVLEQAKKLAITVANFKVEVKIKNIKDKLEEKKKIKEDAKKIKEEKEKAAKKEEDAKKVKEEKVKEEKEKAAKKEEDAKKEESEDEVKEVVKKDFDKLLTKKQ